jgi:hypothetical protein
MTDSQARLWMTGTALKYMSDNNIPEVTAEVEAHVNDVFLPINEVDNILVAEVVGDLTETVAEWL